MDTVESYLLLGLRLGRHVDGLVDFYYGPVELQEQVGAEPLVSPADLVDEAAGLLGRLDGQSEWLREQTRGLHVYARVLAGERIRFVDEVEGCYGVRPDWVAEDRFAAAHEQLDTLLPGQGGLAGRYERWREGRVVPRERVGVALAALIAVFREWTGSIVELPAGEALELELVEGQSWLAFNYYLGDLRSRIAVNVDLPVTSGDLAVLAAHEAYPGHHTEHALKEARLVRAQGLIEESIALVPTPQPLLSEGIAKLGEELVLESETEAAVADALRDCGLVYDTDQEQAISAARRPLGWVSENAALLLHEQDSSAAEVSAYIERWSLATPERAKRSVAFLTDPTWRAYSSTYPWGRHLCGAWVGGDTARFARLLTEQVTATELRAAAGSPL